MSRKSLTEEIHERMYKDRIEKIELLGGKSREELIRKANTLKSHRRNYPSDKRET